MEIGFTTTCATNHNAEDIGPEYLSFGVLINRFGQWWFSTTFNNI
jgi:hypothetical protein